MQSNPKICHEEFAVLNFIDIKYSVPLDLLVSVLGKNFKDIETVIEKLVKEGYVKEYEKSFLLTELGRERVKLNRREIVNGLTNEEKQLLKKIDSTLCDLSYFLQYNVTKFQLRADSQRDIINSIEEINNEVTLALKNLLPSLPHLKIYLDRLEESLSKIRDGNILFIVYEPNSYYYVFYEMRTDIRNLVSEME